MPDDLLKIEGLKTHFHTFAGVIKAVDGVDFHVNEGEILGVVGESGCGKSVLGFSIMGLVDPPGRIESGRIVFKGRNLARLDERELRKIRGREIQLLFDSYLGFRQ